MSEKIVIPEQFYVNYSERTDRIYDYQLGKYIELGTTKLGFATYQEDNAAFRKRQATVDGWADKKKYKGETIANTPRTGFKLAKMVTHGGGWNDKSVYWRVIDPTGFELEISAGNVAKLFQYCHIELGDIKGECVWGWDKGNGSSVVLIPNNSELYTRAKQTSDVHYAKSLALKDLNIGDEVELKNDVKGTYFGKMTYAYYEPEAKDFGKISLAQTYVFMTKEILKGKTNELYFMSTPKVIAAKPGAKVFSKEEAEDLLNRMVVRGARIGRAGSSQDPWHTVFLTYDDPKKLEYSFEKAPVSKEDFSKFVKNEHKPGSGWHHNQVSSMRYYYEQYMFTTIAGSTVALTSVRDSNMVNHRDAKPKDLIYSKFIKGETDELVLDGHVVLDTNFDVNKGLVIEKNPQYTDDKSRWSYRREKYEIEREFMLSNVAELFKLRVQFKGMLYPLKRNRFC